MVTPEEHLEARAEQLVEAMSRALCGSVYNGEEVGWVSRWELLSRGQRDLWLAQARAALNVVRTERSQITCATCGGTTVLIDKDLRTRCTACIDGSVPGELLVVGLIGGEG